MSFIVNGVLVIPIDENLFWFIILVKNTNIEEERKWKVWDSDRS